MQILRAARAAWTFMAEKSLSLKKRPDGTLPMVELFDSLPTATEVMLFLMPLPGGASGKRPSASQVLTVSTTGTGSEQLTPPKKSRTKARRDRQKQRLQEAFALAPAPSVQQQAQHAFPPKPPHPTGQHALPPTPPPAHPKGKGKGKQKSTA